MNTTGKTLLSAFVLAVLLGGGWWLMDRDHPSGPSGPAVEPIANAASVAMPSVDLLNELEASLRFVSETVAVNGNISVGVALVDMLDARLARLPNPGIWAEMRKALAADRQTLVQLQSVDIVALARQLDLIVADIDQLPLISAPRPLMDRSQPKASPSTGALAAWQEILNGLQSRLADVIRIRRVENPEAVFLTPEQGALVAERLRLRLISARFALISRQDKLLESDIAQSLKILEQAFDTEHERVRMHRETLRNVVKTAGTLKPMTPMSAFAALGALRSRTSNGVGAP
ncbi:MAG: uroporphyrinogen-III C-methyltransferase [Burkholderiaceae bacterium]